MHLVSMKGGGCTGEEGVSAGVDTKRPSRYTCTCTFGKYNALASISLKIAGFPATHRQGSTLYDQHTLLSSLFKLRQVDQKFEFLN